MNAAASGMEAQETRMDLIANNLANVNTTGYKKVRGEFQDLLYDEVRAPAQPTDGTTGTPTGLQVGLGVRTVGTQRQFTMGDLKQTGNALDIAIEGNGFFQLTLPSGQLAYTRDGSFKVDALGRMVNADGHSLDPGLTLPKDARGITINADGTVSVTQGDDTSPTEVGKIDLASFANPAGLEPLGHNLFTATPASGDPLYGTPGREGLGALAQGFLETSNVKVVEEMIDLIATQRAYETNSKVIQAADEMLRATSALK